MAQGEGGGPKPKRINLEELKKWARAGATIPEMAARLGVSKATLDRRLAKPKFREALEGAKAELWISLRSKQVQMALAGDRVMLIWLGKQYLGQKDRQEFSGEANVVLNVSSRDEILSRINSMAERIRAAQNNPKPL
jgi:hypothetical protein